MNELLTAALYYQDSHSDKVYNVAITEKPGGYNVCFSYGRRGTSLTTGCKTSSPISYTEALKTYRKLVASKKTKGYKHSGTTPSVISTMEPKVHSGVQLQLLNEIPLEDVETYILDPEWFAQEKYDGVRKAYRALNPPGTKWEAINKKGITVATNPLFVQDLCDVYDKTNLGNMYTFDAEDMGDYLAIFDIVHEAPFHNRHTSIANWFARYENNAGKPLQHIRLVPYAQTEAQKRILFASLKAENAEGIVFRRNSTYQHGRPNKGGDVLKYKFCATATCEVSGIHTEKRSVSIRVYDGQGNPIEVGNVTIYPNQEIPEIGNCLEIKYLYAIPNSMQLFQPVNLGIREDNDKEDCKFEQLKFKRVE